MAYYPKYNKKKKSKKAFVGAATAAIGLGKAIYGGIQANRAKKAEKAFNKDRLKMGVSKATQQMVDEPIDQDYIERTQQQQGASQASAMDALKRDPRNTLAGVQALSQQAGNQRTAMLGLQQDAKTKALTNLAQEQRSVEKQRLAVAGQELEGIRGEKAAGVQNLFGGIEDIASGIGGMNFGGNERAVTLDPANQVSTIEYDQPEAKLRGRAKKGGKIESEEGGVTPGKFDHNSNPIDMVQDGEKIGEATGGELILPPDDVEAVRAALEGGDKDAAFELMQDLVAKYDENVIEADQEEEKEVPSQEEPPMEQGPMMKRGGYLEKVKARMGSYMKSKY